MFYELEQNYYSFLSFISIRSFSIAITVIAMQTDESVWLPSIRVQVHMVLSCFKPVMSRAECKR